MSLDLEITSLESPEKTKAILKNWHIRDFDRGHRNLCHLAENIGPQQLQELMPALHRLVPRCPDPDRSLNNLERFLSTRKGKDKLGEIQETRSRTLEPLLQLFSISQFFSDLLVANPDYLEMIRIPLRSSPSRTELLAHLREEVGASFEDSTVLRAFRHFRKRQILRIGSNDIIRDRPLEEITRDISRVADTALEVALEVAYQNVAKRFGEPFSVEGNPCRCVILAFGKHGGQELNYSSDIDLMFLYDEEGQTVGPKHNSILNNEFFSRVTKEVVRLLSSHTDNGQAYRIDLRLRPEGQRGPLARSLKSTLSYYDNLGRTWERQALIKLRPVAGDIRLGEDFIKAIEPFVYRKYLNFAEINEIKALKRRIEHKTHQVGATETNVKTGHGGIRDVEFTIQFLQLLNGGDSPEVRQRNTLKALQALESAGCLTDQEYQILDSTYRFLRKTEHRLQIMLDLQTHKLPEKEEDLHLFAISLGYSDEEKEDRTVSSATDAFLTEYREKTGLNRKILDHLLHETFKHPEGQAEPETDLILEPEPSPETIREVLGKYPFRDIQGAYHNLSQLAQESVPFLSTRRCRHFLASIASPLLRAISETPDPDLTLVNLEMVSRSLGGKAVLWELFSFSPAALNLYVDLCAWSQFLSEILIKNPGMIDELLDSLILNQPRTEEELRQELRELCFRASDPDLILHSFRDKELLRIGVRDILEKDTLQETTAALSDLAEAILSQITDLSLPPLVRRYGIPYLEEGPRQGQPARFAILGLGKLGGREMSYHSDLDLILVYEGDGHTGPPPGASRFDKFETTEHLHYFTEVARAIIKGAGFMGPRGRLYQVDFRLRPTGKSGSLVTPLKEFHRYYHGGGGGQLWERQALTRTRVVYGDPEFGEEVLSALMDAAYSLPWRPEMADEIYHMRERVQASGSQRDLKRGYGGLVDIEFLVQLFRLKYGQERQSIQTTNTWEALKALRAENLLNQEEFQTLWDSHEYLRLVESRLRLVHNRSLDELPESPSELDKLSKGLGFEIDEENSASNKFLAKLDEYLTRTRELFVRLIEREKNN